jgi:glycosyltransferase involved in cell wall biosynthesis
VSDHRIPVAVLNVAWHWLEWPSAELIAHDRFDVAFSPHPLLLPTRAAVQVVMVHDLDFLDHPERTRREIRRDYPRLARAHTQRASRVIVPSRYTADEVVRRLSVQRDNIVVCPPGVPEWREEPRGSSATGYVLFMGTLEPRKNVGALLDAYARFLGRRPTAPMLVLAGGAGPEAQPWLDAMTRPPLAGHVEHLGYITERDRQRVYAGARLLVVPSYEEGFGMPALEAMSLGIPVIASDRGALPELLGDAGVFIDPDDAESLAAALDRVLTDADLAAAMSVRGRERSRGFLWTDTAKAVRQAFHEAIEDRSRRRAS